MAETVYIETTIPSLCVSRPSSRIVEAARQQLTRAWWDCDRGNFGLVCSQTVLDECGRGEKEMATARLNPISDLPLLDLTDEVLEIAQDLLKRQIIPSKAGDDAVHIACASVHRIDYLLTWNCKHIANPRNRPRIRSCLTAYGYEPTIICTPEDLSSNEY